MKNPHLQRWRLWILMTSFMTAFGVSHAEVKVTQQWSKPDDQDWVLVNNLQVQNARAAN